MAHDSKQSFFSSLFGRKQKEPDEAAELESRHRLDERIRRIMAETGEVPGLRDEKESVAFMAKEQEAGVELLQISANGLGPDRATVPATLLPSSGEVARFYTANQR